jgi:hypothetical protein
MFGDAFPMLLGRAGFIGERPERNVTPGRSST